MDNSYVVDLADPEKRIIEVERLKQQGYALTESLRSKDRSLFPDGFPKGDVRVVDLGCGAGEWVLGAAHERPLGYVIGIDANDHAIAYANAQAVTQQRENAEFRVGDILQPLDFEDETFDLVVSRLLSGLIPRHQWPDFVAETYRICRPGGYVRMTEAEMTSIAGCPAFHRMSMLAMSCLYDAGKIFSRSEFAISHMLRRFMVQAGFVDVQMQPYLIDLSVESPLYGIMKRDLLAIPYQMKPLFLRLMSEEDFESTCAQMKAEMDDPAFSGVWVYVAVQGRKPA